jgi:Holliday junction resolvasome RuvABC ATP-dependent DNA helicase subunit
MKKQEQKQIINNDVHGDFLKDINIWNIQGQSHVVTKLKIIVQEYFNNKSDGRNPKVKNILLSGNKNTGKTTLAYAYSNSLCCSQLFEADGSILAMGGECIYTFLKQGDENSSYLIHNSEKLSAYCLHILQSALRANVLTYHDPMNNKTYKYNFKKLLIFNCLDINRVNHQIVKNVDTWFNINNVFMDDEIYKILVQRISYLGWEIEEQEKFINSIIAVVKNEISRAIEILGWAHSCARAEGEDRISLKQLNRALHLLG